MRFVEGMIIRLINKQSASYMKIVYFPNIWIKNKKNPYPQFEIDERLL